MRCGIKGGIRYSVAIDIAGTDYSGSIKINKSTNGVFTSIGLQNKLNEAKKDSESGVSEITNIYKFKNNKE